ncbi:uncharacterized protein [Garra rufa]|uniref:uncharacterized protein n=1 Tax=Garra rufa TaxID=137080 RepID=UPI003CCEDBBE
MMVGDSVTLYTDIKVQKEDVIKWFFKKTPIAEINEGSSDITASDVEFKARLQLDSQTGDLKIRNINTIDSGDYKLEISRTGESPEKIFNVNVLPDDEVRSVTLMVGDSVTLHTYRNKKQGDEFSLFRGTLRYGEGLGGRLKLDNQTGSLNITNIATTDSGPYDLQISRSNYTVNRRITVTVVADVKSVSVMDGDSVTLHTGLTEIQTDDQILWKFGEQDIACLKGSVHNTPSNIDLNCQTGDLNIRNIQKDHDGDYKMEIITRRMILHRKYYMPVIDAMKSPSVKEGDSVALSTVTETQNNDLIQWLFGNITIGMINQTAQQFLTYNGPVQRFRHRLELDHKTRSLTITNTKTTDSGHYDLKISSSRCTINRRIIVTVTGVFGESVSEVKGNSVTLVTGLTEIQTDDVLEWRFGAERNRIARINKAAGVAKTYDEVLGGIFKDRLKLDDKTGSLTIVNVRSTDNGDYEVATDIAAFKKTFTVIVSDSDSGLSPGAIAGIVVAVLVAVAAAVAGVFYKKTKSQVL